VSQGESFSRDLFSYIRIRYRWGRGRGRKEREIFPVSHSGNESKDSKWWSPTLSFIVESWENTHGQG
jgi:hypothetical protein